MRVSYLEERKKKMEEKRIAKKQRLKAMFDAEYDDKEGEDGTYFDSLKSEMEQQAQVLVMPIRFISLLIFKDV